MYRVVTPRGEGDLLGQAFAAAAAKQVVDLYPENWQTFQLFARLSTQWNAGMAGPTGLRYEAAYPLIDRMTRSPQEWDEVFDDLQLMEHEALKAMREAD